MRATPGISRHSVAIAALSTIVEWYDFTLYLYFSTVLSRVFFGGGELALAFTLGGFAISYLLRPLGALCFGRIGDRFGRRHMLLISMALMTVTMLMTSLLPTYTQLGISAGILVLILRGIMSFSVGGEYTGVVAYLLEGSRPDRRGLVTSLASAASEIGALLAVGVSALTVALLSESALESWGWRIPFLVGFVLAGSLWLGRAWLEESPGFLEHQQTGTSVSLRESIIHFRPAIGRSFAISALGSATYYLGITYVPVFLVTTGAFTEKDALSLSVVAAISVVVITPLAGNFSDRIGRRPMLLLLAVGSAFLPLVVFMLMTGGSYAISMLGAVLMACLAGCVSAVGTSSTSEQFPVAVRLTGLALGTTVATAIFGGLTPWLAQTIITSTGSHSAPGLIITLIAVCVLPVFFYMPETAPGKRK
ncbi:MFS transporter [Klebsiella aerogenes]